MSLPQRYGGVFSLRRLMLYLIGPEESVNMSAHGKRGNGVPNEILDAVKCN